MMIGKQYKIISELGSGGMGVVFQAVDVLLEREVAIKKLRTDFSQSPDVAERFLREARIQARLNHPNITQLYTFLREDDVFYIVMEFVGGSPLNKLIPVPYQRLLPMAVQILDTLDYAHNMGVLHRDIKPDNLMVTANGSIKIMDFGIAHVLGSTRQTRNNMLIGTLEYISPERIMGKDPERSSDVYSVGVVLFEALTGRLPFEGPSEFELQRQHLQAPPPKIRTLLPECPEGLEEVINKALAKEPVDRFATCAEMKDALVVELAKLTGRASSGQRPVRNVAEEFERCRRRITALIKSHDFELAQRVLDSARIDYPGHERLTELQVFLSVESKRFAMGSGDLRRHVADTLQEIARLHQQANSQAAIDLAIRSFELNPQVKAFQIAALCCSRAQDF